MNFRELLFHGSNLSDKTCVEQYVFDNFVGKNPRKVLW